MTSLYKEICFLIRYIDSLEIEETQRITIHLTLSKIIDELLHKN